MLQMQTRFENIEMFLAHWRITTIAARINFEMEQTLVLAFSAEWTRSLSSRRNLSTNHTAPECVS